MDKRDLTMDDAALHPLNLGLVSSCLRRVVMQGGAHLPRKAAAIVDDASPKRPRLPPSRIRGVVPEANDDADCRAVERKHLECQHNRCNQTHESTTDGDAKLARKGAGKEAKLSYSGNLLIENRNGLIVNAELLEANGRAERDAALRMLEQLLGDQRLTVGGDKGFDTAEFVAECRHMNVTPHVAQNEKRPGGSAIDERTTRHGGYAISQKKRKRIEECFGWMKDIALLRKLKHRGLHKVGWIFSFAAAAYNLVRLRKLIPVAAGVR